MKLTVGMYLAGLTDGEGCFYIQKHYDRPGYTLHFKITLRADDCNLLKKLQKQFGGNVGFEKSRSSKNPNQQLVWWVVHNKKDLLGLVNYFDSYPLQSKKSRDYQLWREAVLIWANQTKCRDWIRIASISEDIKKIRTYNPELVK